TKSSTSNTPSANRLKKRSMPFSETLPRTLRTLASGSIFSASGSRSCSVPPVPCNKSNVRLDTSFPFRNRCFISNPSFLAFFITSILIFFRKFFRASYSIDRSDHFFNFFAFWFQKRRQDQFFAKCFIRFIFHKSRAVCCYFK